MEQSSLTTLTENQALLQEAKQAFTMMKGCTHLAMQKLFKIKEENVWTEVSPTWGVYVEQELGISQSFASRLLTVHRIFLTEGGLQPQQLQGIDTDKLYLAKDLEGTAEEKVAKAKTLTRLELKQSKGVDDPNHAHVPKTITICDTCGLRLSDAQN